MINTIFVEIIIIILIIMIIIVTIININNKFYNSQPTNQQQSISHLIINITQL